jgi:predicted methyltransferase
MKELTLISNKTDYIILRSLSENPLSYWDILLNSFDNSINTINSLEKLLKDNLIKYENNLFYLTEEGKNLVKNLLKIKYEDLTCNECNSKGLRITKYFREVLDNFLEVTKDRPNAIPEFDQGVVEPLTLIYRVIFMYYKGDIENKDIVLIGDDDLTSIILGLSNLPKSILVLEADKRLVDYINNKAQNLNLNNLRAQVYNVEDSVNQELLNSFDTFLTDPVETIEGITLFISRGVSMLKQEGVVYFGLTHLEASYKKWHKIHSNLYSMNLVITDLLDKFQLYDLNPDDIVNKGYRVYTEAVNKLNIKLDKPSKPWYNSAFHRLVLVDKPKPYYSPNEQVKLNRDLYYDDEAYVTLY